jgi:hypothetical protein
VNSLVGRRHYQTRVGSGLATTSTYYSRVGLSVSGWRKYIFAGVPFARTDSVLGDSEYFILDDRKFTQEVKIGTV